MTTIVRAEDNRAEVELCKVREGTAFLWQDQGGPRYGIVVETVPSETVVQVLLCDLNDRPRLTRMPSDRMVEEAYVEIIFSR